MRWFMHFIRAEAGHPHVGLHTMLFGVILEQALHLLFQSGSMAGFRGLFVGPFLGV
jgi:hypothetical protein